MERNTSTEFDWLKEVLVGRTIINVEAGTSNGWVLIHFSQTEEETKKWPEGSRIFLNIKVDGPVEGEARHYWNAALNVKGDDNGGTSYPVRDHRMPRTPLQVLREDEESAKLRRELAAEYYPDLQLPLSLTPDEVYQRIGEYIQRHPLSEADGAALDASWDAKIKPLRLAKGISNE